MRTFKSVAVIVAALAGILGLSIWSALGEQERLVGELTMATRRQVHASVEALSARLDALDQDTRVLTDLVENSRSNGELDPATERRVWESAFRALAVTSGPRSSSRSACCPPASRTRSAVRWP